MPVPKGQRFGGRQKGTKNKTKKVSAIVPFSSVIARATDLAVREIIGKGPAGLVEIATERAMEILTGTMKCGVCRGSGRTKYQSGESKMDESGQVHERKCLSCYGSGLERTNPQLVAAVQRDVWQYAFPRLNAVAVAGSVDVNIAEVIRRRFEQRTIEAGELRALENRENGDDSST